MTTFSLAPLQGFTDFALRKALDKHIGGIDKYYTPYLRLQNDMSLKKANIRDVLPQNNVGINLIPQILVNNTKDFLHLGYMLQDYGYTELNWNLGCPYPMVAKRKLGAGLLPFSENILSILDEVLPKLKIDVSIKLRAGYENHEDMETLLPQLNNQPIKELILHPRYGKQLYKGEANHAVFEKALTLTKHNLAYNGDILTQKDIENLKLRFNKTKHIMLGRGLLKNVFLILDYKSGYNINPKEKKQKFGDFHAALFDYYKQSLSGDNHQLNKMIHLWEYFSCLFNDDRKIYKQLKKTKNISEFENKTQYIIQNMEIADP